MSRTTRRPRFLIKTSETHHINRDVASAIRFPDFYIRVRMTEAELDAEYERNLKSHKVSVVVNLFHFYYYRNEVPTRRTSGYKRVPIKKSMDEVIAESKRDFSTYTRDGKWNETDRNTGFKQEAAKCVRNANKRFCSTVLRGEEHENTIYPHEHLGDQFVWNYW